VKRLKVLIVFGTRPEAIKLAPVIKELERYPDEFTSLVCVTAQHREMLDQVLQIFDIQPDYDLNVMLPNQTLTQLTANLLTRLDQVMAEECPDWVLVQGDTTTVMAASLVAYYHRTRVGHVEAGLRTDDKWQPYPEEINRRVTDVLTDLYFAPTERNQQNLLREGVPEPAIVVTGNTVIDALLMITRRVSEQSLPPQIGYVNGKRLILVTAHRRESFGGPLANICRALAELARHYEDVHIVYPVHLNPNVARPVHEMLAGIDNISLIEPLDYETFVNLINRSYLILTDSGGLQEEAPSLNKPLLVLRDVTERPEALLSGATRLVGTNPETIVRETVRLLEDPEIYQKMASATNPYGDGQASQRIIQALRRYRDQPRY
jgi:UDP-N-acetylglucosamine 2-epimerase (non-hydrolysing)